MKTSLAIKTFLILAIPTLAIASNGNANCSKITNPDQREQCEITQQQNKLFQLSPQDIAKLKAARAAQAAMQEQHQKNLQNLSAGSNSSSPVNTPRGFTAPARPQIPDIPTQTIRPQQQMQAPVVPAESKPQKRWWSFASPKPKKEPKQQVANSNQTNSGDENGSQGSQPGSDNIYGGVNTGAAEQATDNSQNQNQDNSSGSMNIYR